MKKDDLMIMTGLMSIMLIITLMIPAITGYVTHDRKETIVISLDPSEYVHLGYVNSATINETVFENVYLPGYILQLEEANNETWYLRHTTGIKNYAKTNDVTTVGNNNTCIVNYSATGTPNFLFHGLDMTAHEMAEYDFLHLTSNAEHGQVFMVWYNQWGSLSSDWFMPTGGDNFLFTISSFHKQDLLASPDNKIYLSYQNIDITDVSYTWSLTVNDLPDTVWSWTDTQLYAISLMASILIMAVTIAFNTDTLDIKIDTNRKDRR